MLNESEKDHPEEGAATDSPPPSFMQNKLLQSRSIIISGEINQPLAERVSSQLLVLQEISPAPIKVFINSQGGHVEAGDTLHDIIRFIEPEVLMIGTGWVASAGVTVYLATPKERRFCLPNTRFMIHQPLGAYQGKASDIQIEATEMLLVRERINRLISEATGQPLEKVAKDTDRNYWMRPEQALDYGIVGSIVNGWKQVK